MSGIMKSFKQFLNEFEIEGDVISHKVLLKYLGFSSNTMAVNGTYLRFSLNDIEFGISVLWGDSSHGAVPVYISPNSKGDWRNMDTDDAIELSEYFGYNNPKARDQFESDREYKWQFIKYLQYVEFKSSKDVLEFFIKHTDDPNRIADDLLHNTRHDIPSDLKKVLKEYTKDK